MFMTGVNIKKEELKEELSKKGGLITQGSTLKLIDKLAGDKLI